MIRRVALCLLLAGCDRVFGAELPDAAVAIDADDRGCLRDTFDDGAIDDTLWAVGDPDNTPHAVLQRDGELVISLSPSAPTAYSGNVLGSQRRYDLTGGYAIVENTQPVLAGGAEAYLILYGAPSPGINQYSINTGGGGSIGFAIWRDGVRTIEGRPYAASDRFWRILHDVPTSSMQLAVSANGRDWSTPVSYPASIPVDDLRIALGAGTFTSGNPDPGAAKFDNFQLVTPTCPAP